MTKSEKQMLLSLLLEEDGSEEVKEGPIEEINEIARRVNDSVRKLSEQYNRLIDGLKDDSSIEPIEKSVVTFISFIRDLAEEIKNENILNKSDGEKEFRDRLKNVVRTVVVKFRDSYSEEREDHEVIEKIYEDVIKKYEALFEPDSDVKLAIQVVKKIKEATGYSEDEEILKVVRGLIYRLSGEEKFIQQVSINYLERIAQITSSSLFSMETIKKILKYPLQIVGKIKEIAVKLWEKIKGLSGISKLIGTIILVALSYVAIKKFPVLGKFFGESKKLFLAPFNKVISFFKKSEKLLEAYLTDPVARKLIETKVRKMDMYAALYLSV